MIKNEDAVIERKRQELLNYANYQYEEEESDIIDEIYQYFQDDAYLRGTKAIEDFYTLKLSNLANEYNNLESILAIASADEIERIHAQMFGDQYLN